MIRRRLVPVPPPLKKWVGWLTCRNGDSPPSMTHVYIHTRLSRYTSHHPMDRLKLYTYVTHMLCLHTLCVCVSLSISVCAVCVLKGGTVFQLREFSMSPLDWTFESGSRRSFFYYYYFRHCGKWLSKKIKNKPTQKKSRRENNRSRIPALICRCQIKKRIGKGKFLMMKNSFS
jgi:hypothetical protein